MRYGFLINEMQSALVDEGPEIAPAVHEIKLTARYGLRALKI